MKLRIKKGLFSWKIVDESGAIVASISDKKLMCAAKKIKDSKGNTIFTTDIINATASEVHKTGGGSRRYIVCKDRNPVATATFTYAQEPQTFAFRLPHIDHMDVDTSYGVWVINREKNNSLTITKNDELIATVTPFFSFKPKYINHNGDYEATFLAVIYTLVEYMMHEDDLIIV